jgi:hypothetical protein
LPHPFAHQRPGRADTHPGAGGAKFFDDRFVLGIAAGNPTAGGFVIST